MPDHDLQCSGQRFSVEYHIHASATQARRRAELLCIDQTVEAADHVIPSGWVRDHLLGRVLHFESLSPEVHRAIISLPTELLDGSMTRLLHMTFGMAGLQGQVRLTDLSLPDDIVSAMAGPRFGVQGVRALLQIPERPLVCAVLKPVGLSPRALAALADQFALGEVDLIKDDQSLGDHPFCRFEERIARCVETIAEASRRTGRRCLYAPHVSGSWPVLHEQAFWARRAGAGALLICPGLTGFDAMTSLASLPSLSIPLIAHPDFLGSHYACPDSGIAPSVLFGLLARLAGADVSIYPTYGSTFPISEEDCRHIALSCRRPLGDFPPIFPTAAGRMSALRIDEMTALYGRDLVYILGSDLRKDPLKVTRACREFLRRLEKAPSSSAQDDY
jgi:ribulose-bisphosphate carboxylase large chain